LFHSTEFSPPTFCKRFSSFPSQHMSFASFLSLEFPHQNSICIFPPFPPHTHTHATCLVNLTLLYLITIIFDEERIMKLLHAIYSSPLFLPPT
jgi:hypothetical protein